MPDTLETKAVKRLLRWVSLLTALAVPTQDLIRIETPDPWTAAMLMRLKADYETVQHAGFGFGLLNDHSLDGLFLQILINEEFNILPWGRALQHLVLREPVTPGLSVFLSRFPYIFLPQECMVTGQSLGLTRENFAYHRGGKGKIKTLDATESWKEMRRKIRASLDANAALSESQDSEQLLKQHRDNFSIHWEAYKILTEKAEMSYTPRYQLFDAYRDIPFASLFLKLFLERYGRDEPIQLADLPPMFHPSLEGKRLVDFEDEAGQPVNALGQPLGPEFITLKQLDDFFLYQNT